MLSVLRSGWNGPALKVGKPTFLKRVHHPVFPLKELEPEVYEFPSLQTSVDKNGVWGGDGAEIRPNSWQRNLQWADAASDTQPWMLGLHSAGQLTLD